MVGSAETCSHMQTKFFCPLETDWEAISGQKMPTLPLANQEGADYLNKYMNEKQIK